MSDMSVWLWLIPCLPLMAAALILFAGEAVLRRLSHWPCVLAIAGSCVLSFVALAYVRSAGKEENPGLERVIEEVEADPKEGHVKDAVGVLRKLGYYDLSDRARALRKSGDGKGGVVLELTDEQRAARLKAILLRARERHKEEAKNPDRILYSRFSWIAASPAVVELDEVRAEVEEADPEFDDDKLADAPARAVAVLGRLHYDDLSRQAGGLEGAPPELIKQELQRVLEGAHRRSLKDPLISRARVSFGLRVDALSAIMLVMITSIATCIATYASGYMKGDPGYPRFFAEVSLFVFSMTMLVMGDNFLLLFLGWEGVGLCSYLLIGFWYQKPSAADAARKAFLVTRLGDVGMFIGILMLWFRFGTVEYDAVFGAIVEGVNKGELSEGFLTATALLLFCGAVGKSAQFPLHVWLPDAMEGPTPVSALIHAATMVTAGVYLVARCTPLFMVAPDAQMVVALSGGITMVLAALIALTQHDLKRVLAYSTLSQLGYMFLALGCALKVPGKTIGSDVSHPLTILAVTAAMFHLFTHAFFKALLFLSAGSVMTAMHHVIDMRRFSGLRKVLPITHWTFLAGAVSLAALPLTSGFFSKDEILAAVWDASHQSGAGTRGTVYLVLLAAGILTAGLTAFYTFRAYFKTFWGELKLPEEVLHGHGSDHSKESAHDSHGGHGRSAHAPAAAVHKAPAMAHESPAVMTIPLIILAVPALIVGGLLGPTHLFGGLIGKTPYFPEVEAEHGNWFTTWLHHTNWPLLTLGTSAGLIGLALAYLMYRVRPELPAELAKKIEPLYQASLNKFFFDEIYLALVVRPAEALARLIGSGDKNILDEFVDLVGQVPRLIGALFRPVQNGLVQFYALAMILGLAVFLLALVRSL
jgi:NADH-quinone oxidoreductase subunit L